MWVVGYIGRFLALHLEEQQLASEVRLVDKVLPQLAWLAPEFDAACAGDRFLQADASRERAPSPLSPPSSPIHTPPLQLPLPSHASIPRVSGHSKLTQRAPTESMAKIFTPARAAAYTHVFNCGGETRYSQEDSVYALRSVALTRVLATECRPRPRSPRAAAPKRRH